MSKKILITGASGFIGSTLVDEALAKGYEVYAGIRASSKKDNLGSEKIKFVQLNYENPVELDKTLSALDRFDYVIHNAGIIKALKIEEFTKVNCQYTINFAESLIRINKVPDKFVFMSSLAAIGPGNPKAPDPIPVDATPKPITNYGRSKLEAEVALSKLGDKLPYMIIRPTGVYGPRDYEFLQMFSMIKSGINVKMGTSDQYLSLVFVKDLVNAVFLAAESPVKNKAYFVADGNIYNPKILADAISKSLNKKYFNITLPTPLVRSVAFFIQSYGNMIKKPQILTIEKTDELSQINWYCDIEPLKKDLNFKPSTDLQTGIDITAKWYKEKKLI